MTYTPTYDVFKLPVDPHFRLVNVVPAGSLETSDCDDCKQPIEGAVYQDLKTYDYIDQECRNRRYTQKYSQQ